MATQSRPPTILLTRPLPQSQRFAAQLRARWPDVEVVISPLMAPQYLQPDLPPDDFAALVLTSETGAEAARRISAAGARLPMQAICVGDRTALAAKAAGFQTRSAQGDADALIAHILTACPTGPLLVLHGADTAGNIANRLILAGIETVSRVTYVQTQQPLSATATDVLLRPSPVIVPLFSPRSARIFHAERPKGSAIAPLWVAALSRAVAEAAVELHPSRLSTAVQPDADAMLNVVAALVDDGMGS